mmetsp:Transcript_52225/g.124520  ORF Transcript_52225/g.124520 Transcript_52225/m.124520 type:complete len:405 (+) Transcript_52225:63-1277(+)|eukprot:CAMPEP_0178414046 /NCGR_PEP_ID=MMETSP0689_2-20121128/22836_1 /TAXON_ID=160604 /ORGANISM="Amphidinium massartii, Strain CS-259" /LENGTH=404 /DNA_ID=CAMNT_0020035327 /DNA_START=62 /DNA_END=1279 /DNA_ORIENTATION=+
MAGVTGNPYASNRHGDVLNEDPTDEAAKIRLVEEVKNRAKGAFQQKDMVSAELLYGKAISLLESLPEKREAVLYSNRAMVRLNLNKVEGALEDSKKCLEMDPKNVKAWHRKAQALVRLSEWDAAIQAAEEGMKIEPDNKVFPEVIEKAKKDKAQDAEDKAKLKRDAQDVKVELHNASTARQPVKKKEEEKKKAAEDEDGTDLSMRGYKTRADGKKTSYFHTDISEEAKKLIAEQGFGKPQKLDDAAAVAAGEVKGGGSQWNQAGTYEEKGMKKWVEERLPQVMEGIVFNIPTGAGGTISTAGVNDIKGDASISVSRGKRRRLMDISFNVSYEAKVGDTVGKGKLDFTEVTASGDDDWEVKVEIDKDTPPSVREVLDAFVKSSGQGLQPLVNAAIKKMIAEYVEK